MDFLSAGPDGTSVSNAMSENKTNCRSIFCRSHSAARQIAASQDTVAKQNEGWLAEGMLYRVQN